MPGMLENNNPFVNVEEVMAKIRAEIALRHLPQATAGEFDSLPPSTVVTIARIESSIDAAESAAHPRTTWPGRLNRFPLSNRRIQRFFLRCLAFLFRDQRKVNFAIAQALRDSLVMNARLAEQVDQLRARLNAVDGRVTDAKRHSPDGSSTP
jgi:hypothetical protein